MRSPHTSSSALRAQHATFICRQIIRIFAEARFFGGKLESLHYNSFVRWSGLRMREKGGKWWLFTVGNDNKLYVYARGSWENENSFIPRDCKKFFNRRQGEKLKSSRGVKGEEIFHMICYVNWELTDFKILVLIFFISRAIAGCKGRGNLRLNSLFDYH